MTIQVYRIPVPKDRLRSMPKAERAFLLLLGYAANQLWMLQKLLVFSSNKTPPNNAEQYLSAAQTQMLLRYIVGILNETWLLIERLFISRPLGNDYQSLLDADGQQALANLKRQFGASNLLNKIRNDFAFHYPKEAEVEEAFKTAFEDSDLDDHWNIYLSEHGFNSFFFLSDLIMIHGIRKGTGSSNLIDAQKKVLKEAVSAVHNVFEFSKAFTAAVWIKNFGAEMLAKDVINVNDAPKIGHVWIPFFVDMDPSSVSNL
jgi:hypothetical protein